MPVDFEATAGPPEPAGPADSNGESFEASKSKRKRKQRRMKKCEETQYFKVISYGEDMIVTKS